MNGTITAYFIYWKKIIPYLNKNKTNLTKLEQLGKKVVKTLFRSGAGL